MMWPRLLTWHISVALIRSGLPRTAKTSILRFGDEAIAESTDRQQMTWLRRDLFNVLSEAYNEIVDRASIRVLPKTPHFFEQRFACHDVSLVPDQVMQ